MILKTITLSEWGVNCYLIGDEATHDAVVIDPGAEPERILDEVRKLGLNVKLILNTHGHGDHIGANKEIQTATGASIAIGRLDNPLLSDPQMNLSALLGEMPFTSPSASRLLDDGDEISIGSLTLQVIATPGHTPGGISLLAPGCVFTGDALFAGAIGRTDFPYCDHEALMRSLMDKLMALPDEIIVYPGHGPSTTIGAERDYNPFLTGDIG